MIISDTHFVIIFLLLVLLGSILLAKLVASRGNKLEWQDLIATNSVLNAYKIGYWVGVVVGGWVTVKTSAQGHDIAAIMGVYLAYLGGVPVASGAIGARAPKRED